MGRKSSAKRTAAGAPPTPPSSPKKRTSVLPLTAAVAVVLLIGGFVYTRNAHDNTAVADAAPAAQPVAPPPQDLKPHPQANLPPLDVPNYPLGRPREAVAAAYEFAAEHPEVLSYVPCFCGCERLGHHGNEDCFVKARDVNGDVVAWEDHGMACDVCLDVATRARELYNEGKSVAEIRATIEKEWAHRTPNHTPTPPAPPQ
jgi:hypothetical protein